MLSLIISFLKANLDVYIFNAINEMHVEKGVCRLLFHEFWWVFFYECCKYSLVKWADRCRDVMFVM